MSDDWQNGTPEIASKHNWRANTDCPDCGHTLNRNLDTMWCPDCEQYREID